jgi:hypothetical protein
MLISPQQVLENLQIQSRFYLMLSLSAAKKHFVQSSSNDQLLRRVDERSRHPGSRELSQFDSNHHPIIERTSWILIVIVWTGRTNLRP